MKSWKKIAVSLLVLLLIGLAIGWSVIRRGFSARETPTKMEEFVATRARALAVPRSYRDRSNPVPDTPETLRAGLEHFADHCAVCHGNDGSGDTPFGKNMYPKPPDFRLSETQSKSDGELFYTIYNGIRLSGMPAFGEKDQSDANSTWQLVRFIRHLPAVTPEEMKHMESMNPKSPMEMGEESNEEEFLKGGQPSKSMEKMKPH
jgi:mono/diheme cytochrome c family protein